MTRWGMAVLVLVASLSASAYIGHKPRICSDRHRSQRLSKVWHKGNESSGVALKAVESSEQALLWETEVVNPPKLVAIPEPPKALFRH